MPWCKPGPQEAGTAPRGPALHPQPLCRSLSEGTPSSKGIFGGCCNGTGVLPAPRGGLLWSSHSRAVTVVPTLRFPQMGAFRECWMCCRMPALPASPGAWVGDGAAPHPGCPHSPRCPLPTSPRQDTVCSHHKGIGSARLCAEPGPALLRGAGMVLG